ncbi:MAG: glutamate racemase, partial [Candidatus Cloacimonetes bacterium]|nr:glutamate racemase [Candidatus Cloacimonadota bacterium]
NTVIDYSMQNARFLLQQNVKVIVVACNTSSAVALDSIKEISHVPVLGVIEAGSQVAMSTTKNGKVGVIGTEGTIKSHAYQKAIKAIYTDAQVFEKACPLFVPLAEEGWVNNEVARRVAEIYLQDLIKEGIDTLVLGCTHYPILKNVIREVCGADITLIDSAEAIKSHLKNAIEPSQASTDEEGTNFFYVSDNEVKFCSIAKDILGIKEFILQKVTFCKSWSIV